MRRRSTVIRATGILSYTHSSSSWLRASVPSESEPRPTHLAGVPMRPQAPVALLLLQVQRSLHAQARSIEPGAVVPDFTLERLDGGQLALADLRGHPILINFWATCAGRAEPRCRSSSPPMAPHRTAGLEIVAVNLTDQEKRKSAPRFVAELGMPFPVVLDAKGKVREKYHLVALPTSVFLDMAASSAWFIRGRFLSRRSPRGSTASCRAGLRGRQARSTWVPCCRH